MRFSLPIPHPKIFSRSGGEKCFAHPLPECPHCREMGHAPILLAGYRAGSNCACHSVIATYMMGHVGRKSSSLLDLRRFC
jgi:hypothetical protein